MNLRYFIFEALWIYDISDLRHFEFAIFWIFDNVHLRYMLNIWDILNLKSIGDIILRNNYCRQYLEKRIHPSPSDIFAIFIYGKQEASSIFIFQSQSRKLVGVQTKLQKSKLEAGTFLFFYSFCAFVMYWPSWVNTKAHKKKKNTKCWWWIQYVLCKIHIRGSISMPCKH